MSDSIELGELPNNGFGWKIIKCAGKLVAISPVANPRMITISGLVECKLVPVAQSDRVEVVPKIPLSGSESGRWSAGEQSTQVIPRDGAGQETCLTCNGTGSVPSLTPGQNKICSICHGIGFVQLPPKEPNKA